MTIDELQCICKQFTSVTEDIKWENHLCFCIGRKMFLILGLGQTPVTASFKVNDEEFEELSCREGFRPAPYLARYKWVFVDDINRLTKKEWLQYSKQAYNLIRAKLPKKYKIRSTQF